ncbi:YfhO family protein [Brevibacterium sp. NPDC049920]|uniref:YfhO family protein n=1 Tax=Brevibacterium sp. NPDC049920 TaxID=3155279 RepID=UPI0025F5D021|nr:YfhO family protein [uncultured Brevibacterium sp.]
MRAWLLYALVLVLASLTVFGEVIAHPGTRVFADNDDTSLFIWWLAHAADVVAGWFGQGSGERHLLYSTSMHHPAGVNGGWNTTVLGLALPLVPVTWLAGPVVAYNLTIIAAPVASALAAAALVHRFVPRLPAFVGGFAYGFSTYLVSQASGHLNLAFAVLPPLVALGIVELLRTGPRRRPVVTGVWLGCAIGWQFYVSTELLAGTFLAAVCLLLAVLVCAPRILARAGLQLLGGGLLAAGIAVLIGTPLLLAMFTLPGAPGQTIRPHGVWNNDLLDPLVPGAYTLLGGGPTPIPRQLGLDPSEIGGYTGIVWLVCAALTVLALHRSTRYGTLVRVTALAGLLVWLLSMGAPWYVWGRPVWEHTPFRLVELLPVLGNVLPMRLAVHSTLALSVLLALGLWRCLRSPRPALRRLGPIAAALSLLLVAPGAVTARPIIIPDFYTGAYAEVIPAGSVVKTLPRPVAMATPHADEAMVWQALTGMHYRETGGYFIGSTPESSIIFSAPADPLDAVLDEHRGSPLPDGARPRGREAVDALRARGVDFVVIAVDGAHLPHEALAIAQYTSRAAGAPYLEIDGVYLIDLR